MKGVAIIILISVTVLYFLQRAESIPHCKKVGYNQNMPCEPYGIENGWYAYCYVNNNQWFSFPYRCGLIDPSNSTLGYKEFRDSDSKCDQRDDPSDCPAQASDDTDVNYEDSD